MLVYAPFALCFVTLRDVFMRFPELTYWQDATVPVPYFMQFLCFGKATQEIFSELGETKAKTPIFPGWRTKTEGEPEGGREQPHQGLAPPHLPTREGGVGPLAALWCRLSAYLRPSEVQTLNQSAIFQKKSRSSAAATDEFWVT
jgi:hypothetical protein